MGAICSRSIFVFLLLFTIHFANLEAQCDRARDSLVLIDIFESNPQSQALLNWDLAGSPIDEWTGIRLNTEGCIQELDLINKSIDTLPQTIGLLQSLILFRLRDNQIAYLPEGIFDLERLSFLGLNNNALIDLPQNISSKSGLQNFEIANNDLTILPDSIVNLKKLNWLIAHDNDLTSLPTTIGRLSNLFLLSLDNNSLSSLPVSYTHLRAHET